MKNPDFSMYCTCTIYRVFKKFRPILSFTIKSGETFRTPWIIPTIFQCIAQLHIGKLQIVLLSKPLFAKQGLNFRAQNYFY